MRTTLLLVLLFNFQLSFSQQVETLVSGQSTFNDGLAMDAQGNIYASRYYSSTVTKITPTGQTSIFANGLTNPNGLTFDSNGNLLVCEATANKVTLIDTSGNKSLFVNITNPTNLLYLPDGRLLISSYTQDKVSIMDSAGNISDFWTGSELSGGAVGLAYDSIRKEVYVGNFDDGKINKRDSSGVVTEIGDLPGWCGFICEAGDYIYATAYSVHKIYRIAKDGSGQIEYAGTGSPGQMDGDLSTASFNNPNGILSSITGDTIYISDYTPRSLRMITGVNSVTSFKNEIENSNGFLIYPNPAKDKFNIELAKADEIREIKLYNSSSKMIYEYNRISNSIEYSFELPTNISPGIYHLRIQSSSGFTNKKLYIK